MSTVELAWVIGLDLQGGYEAERRLDIERNFRDFYSALAALFPSKIVAKEFPETPSSIKYRETRHQSRM